MSKETTHIDEWLDRPSMPSDRGECYAKFVLNQMRMPAWAQTAFNEWTSSFKLFCTYGGKVYRVTGASRMGDVWLKSLPANHEDDKLEVYGYDMRVNIVDCGNWGPDRHSVY